MPYFKIESFLFIWNRRIIEKENFTNLFFVFSDEVVRYQYSNISSIVKMSLEHQVNFLSNFTLSFWMNYQYSDHPITLIYLSAMNYYYSFQMRDGFLHIAYEANQTSFSSKLQPNEWYFICKLHVILY